MCLVCGLCCLCFAVLQNGLAFSPVVLSVGRSSQPAIQQGVRGSVGKQACLDQRVSRASTAAPGCWVSVCLSGLVEDVYISLISGLVHSCRRVQELWNRLVGQTGEPDWVSPSPAGFCERPRDA